MEAHFIMDDSAGNSYLQVNRAVVKAVPPSLLNNCLSENNQQNLPCYAAAKGL